ncbi:MAG: hypothetical protein ABF979_13780 [Gluconobacter sp.]|uniref:hypothetical protein n=1 Tax=Gluconobacter sp. TaxID=1876758 RepID=UPI0039E75813
MRSLRRMARSSIIEETAAVKSIRQQIGFGQVVPTLLPMERDGQTPRMVQATPLPAARPGRAYGFRASSHLYPFRYRPHLAALTRITITLAI